MVNFGIRRCANEIPKTLPRRGGDKRARPWRGKHKRRGRARDYSVIASFAPAEAEGKCVYCNHCHPCPAGLDIALINKYYDLARAGDTLARGHYEKLERKAGDCTACGHCDRRCPFQVPQSKRMEEIRDYFGA